MGRGCTILATPPGISLSVASQPKEILPFPIASLSSTHKGSDFQVLWEGGELPIAMTLRPSYTVERMKMSVCVLGR